jgi:hypothetical protein
MNEENNTQEAPDMSQDEQEQLKSLAGDFLERKEVEYKKVAATKEWLFARTERKYPIPIQVEDGIERVFQARRLNESERTKMASVQRRIQTVDPMELSDEEFNLLQSQGYELLEVAIVEPALTKHEWEKVDLALVQKLILRVNVLQYEENDAKAIDEMRNL